MENNKTNNIKVTGATNVTEEVQKTKEQGVTLKTLQAWMSKLMAEFKVSRKSLRGDNVWQVLQEQQAE